MTVCTPKISTIPGTECIGDSRIKINTNFQLLTADICETYLFTAQVSSNVVSLSSLVRTLSGRDSSTIDITFNSNSYTLSAEVIDSSISTQKLGGNITSFGRSLLTAANLSSLNIDLSSLRDVVVASPAPGEALVWDGTTWKNAVVTVSGGGGFGLTDGNKGDITVSFNTSAWNINANAVTESKINDGAVTPSKIYTGAVIEDKIGAGAVTVNKIGPGAVTESKIGTNAVTENKILSSAVTTTKIANNAVSNAKLAQVPAYSVKGNPDPGTLTPTDIAALSSDTFLGRVGDLVSFRKITNESTTATPSNVNSAIVARDSSGNFAASLITSDLSGNATTASRLLIPRNITLTGLVTGVASFDGSTDITLTTGGQTGEVNTADNLGISTDGVGIVGTKNGTTLTFKRILAGTNITVNELPNSVQIVNSIPTQQLCKAWVRFTGAPIPTILSTYNIVSVTSTVGAPTGTTGATSAFGYTFIFTTPMTDANYVIVATPNVWGPNNNSDDQIIGPASSSLITTTEFTLFVSDFNQGSSTTPSTNSLLDIGMIAVFGN